MAFAQLDGLCAQTGAELVWKPFYVAAVFRDVNHNVREMRANVVPAKLAYYRQDMERCAKQAGVRILRPPVYGGGQKPLNSAAALRGAFFAIEQGRMPEYAQAVFHAYWEGLEDVSDRAVLSRLAAEAGLDAGAFDAAVDSEALRGRLMANTAEFIRRGGFGTPSFFVGDQLFFGNDRLDFVRDALLESA